MDRRLCSFHAGGEQCPRPWDRWAFVLGKHRPVCEAHSGISSVAEGVRILWDFKVMALQNEFEKTGDPDLGRRLDGIVERAKKRDMSAASEVYDRALSEALLADVPDAHEAALLAVWRHARYVDGDPRRGGG